MPAEKMLKQLVLSPKKPRELNFQICASTIAHVEIAVTLRCATAIDRTE